MSSIRTLNDVNRERSAVFTGEIHSRSGLIVFRWLPAVAPVLPLVYRACLTLLERSVAMVRHSGVTQTPPAWIAVVVFVALVFAVPTGSLMVGHVLGNVQPVTRRQRHGRWAAHLAFTAPSMLVAMGNFARLLNARSLVTPAWLVLWSGAALFVLLSPQTVVTPIKTPGLRRLPLRTFHAISAAGILVMFLVPHISNHTTAIWSGATLILFTHVACGLRNVRFAGSGSRLLSDRWAVGMIATGALVGSVILAALFGVHVRS